MVTPARSRWLLGTATVLATMLYAIDSTIVNVALPHIQGSLQATQDQAAQDPTGPVAEWLSGLTGRVHHLVVEAEEPEAVPDAVPASDVLDLVGGGSDLGDRWAIAPADNQGLGIVLHAPSGPTESPLAAR